MSPLPHPVESGQKSGAAPGTAAFSCATLGRLSWHIRERGAGTMGELMPTEGLALGRPVRDG